MREDVSYWVLKLTGLDEWEDKPYKPEYLKVPSSVSYDTAFKIIYQIIIAYKKEMIEQGVFHQLGLITMSQIVFLLCKTYDYEVLDRGKFDEEEDYSDNRIKLFSLDWFYDLKSMIENQSLTYSEMLYKNIIRYNRNGMRFVLYGQNEEVTIEKFNSIRILEHKDALTRILDKSINSAYKKKEYLFVITKNSRSKNHESSTDTEQKIIYTPTGFLCGAKNDWCNIEYLLEDILYIYNYNFPEKQKDITLDSLVYLMGKFGNVPTVDVNKKLDKNILNNPNKKMVYLDIERLIKKVKSFGENGPARGCYFFKDNQEVIAEIKTLHGY